MPDAVRAASGAGGPAVRGFIGVSVRPILRPPAVAPPRFASGFPPSFRRPRVPSTVPVRSLLPAGHVPTPRAAVAVLVTTAGTVLMPSAAVAQAPTAPISAHPLARVATPTAAPSAALATAAVPRPASGTDSGADSVAAARGLAGSARVALEASSERRDGGGFASYALSAAALPFVGAHLQLGLAPTYRVSIAPVRAAPGQTAAPSTYQSYGAALTANYVVGGGRGRRWRGYVGGYGSQHGTTRGSVLRTVGGQTGALFFLDPAVALRGELRYRLSSFGSGARSGATVALLTLDPYLFGHAQAAQRAWAAAHAGLGTVDVQVFAYAQQQPGLAQRGLSGTLAPSLTRWAQVGVEGRVVRFSESGGFGAGYVRGFGRVYLPVTTRTQPFAEAFTQRGTYADADLQDGAGWAFGVRRLLHPRVALDAGIRRTLLAPFTFGPPGFRTRVRFPGQTGLVVGLTPRLGVLR